MDEENGELNSSPHRILILTRLALAEHTGTPIYLWLVVGRAKRRRKHHHQSNIRYLPIMTQTP
jgi:hypothetical protein